MVYSVWGEILLPALTVGSDPVHVLLLDDLPAFHRLTNNVLLALSEDAIDFVHGALAGAPGVPLLLRALLMSITMRLEVNALVRLRAVSFHVVHHDRIPLRRLNRLISQLWIRVRQRAHGKRFRYVVTLDMLVILCQAGLHFRNFRSFSSLLFSLGYVVSNFTDENLAEDVHDLVDVVVDLLLHARLTKLTHLRDACRGQVLVTCGVLHEHTLVLPGVANVRRHIYRVFKLGRLVVCQEDTVD